MDQQQTLEERVRALEEQLEAIKESVADFILTTTKQMSLLMDVMERMHTLQKK